MHGSGIKFNFPKLSQGGTCQIWPFLLECQQRYDNSKFESMKDLIALRNVFDDAHFALYNTRICNQKSLKIGILSS